MASKKGSRMASGWRTVDLSFKPGEAPGHFAEAESAEELQWKVTEPVQPHIIVADRMDPTRPDRTITYILYDTLGNEISTVGRSDAAGAWENSAGQQLVLPYGALEHIEQMHPIFDKVPGAFITHEQPVSNLVAKAVERTTGQLEYGNGTDFLQATFDYPIGYEARASLEKLAEEGLDQATASSVRILENEMLEFNLSSPGNAERGRKLAELTEAFDGTGIQFMTRGGGRYIYTGMFWSADSVGHPNLRR